MNSDISNPVLVEWFAKAKSHGQKFDSWTQIALGSEQHKAWIMYFHDIGAMPVTLRDIEQLREKTWTAPCEWPHDQDFTVDSKPPPRRPEKSFEHKAALCHAWLRVLEMPDASTKEISSARQQIIKFSIDVRKRAMSMSIDDAIRALPKLAASLGRKRLHEFGPIGNVLTVMRWRDPANGKVLSSGEPYFLPEWTEGIPPGGRGGAIQWSDEGERYV